MKDGVDLESSERVRMRYDDTDSSLKFEKLLPQDSGNYTCIVTNDFGSDAYSSLLLIKGKCLGNSKTVILIIFISSVGMGFKTG